MTANKRPSPVEMITRARQLRRRMSPVEDRMWGVLRNAHVQGLKFRRQHPIGCYVADFYCHAHRLVIEIDGLSHLGQEQYDDDRAVYLVRHGYRVIRFTNVEVLKNPEGIREAIRQARRLPSPDPPPADRPLPKGEVNELRRSRRERKNSPLPLGEAGARSIERGPGEGTRGHTP